MRCECVTNTDTQAHAHTHTHTHKQRMCTQAHNVHSCTHTHTDTQITHTHTHTYTHAHTQYLSPYSYFKLSNNTNQLWVLTLNSMCAQAYKQHTHVLVGYCTELHCMKPDAGNHKLTRSVEGVLMDFSACRTLHSKCMCVFVVHGLWSIGTYLGPFCEDWKAKRLVQ